MAVVIETTLGDLTVDLFINERPKACLNFLKLCKMKYYNYNLIHNIERGFIAQTGDPSGDRTGGESIFGLLEGAKMRYFAREKTPQITHSRVGLLSFVGTDDGMIGSQFFFTLGTNLSYLDKCHCVFGHVMEGIDVLDMFNDAICDDKNRPFVDVRITHTVVLQDPFPDPPGLIPPSCSPPPTTERLTGGRIAADEVLDDTFGRTDAEVTELIAAREAKARATILEMVGDLPDADIAPPENVLFVCRLNPLTSEDDLEIIFGRFGTIVSCEVIKDAKSGNSLQYAFIEFDNPKSCEDAFFKMDNVLIDERRIHVDFSQSVGKVKWLGKGRLQRDEHDDGNNLGQGIYQPKRNHHSKSGGSTSRRESSRNHKQHRSSKERHESTKKSSGDKRTRTRPYKRSSRHDVDEKREKKSAKYSERERRHGESNSKHSRRRY